MLDIYIILQEKNIRTMEDNYQLTELDSRHRLVIRTVRCGRSNPGSNPGHGSSFLQLEINDLNQEHSEKKKIDKIPLSIIININIHISQIHHDNITI